jgi:hypothetical protein
VAFRAPVESLARTCLDQASIAIHPATFSYTTAHAAGSEAREREQQQARIAVGVRIRLQAHPANTSGSIAPVNDSAIDRGQKLKKINDRIVCAAARSGPFAGCKPVSMKCQSLLNLT